MDSQEDSQKQLHAQLHNCNQLPHSATVMFQEGSKPVSDMTPSELRAWLKLKLAEKKIYDFDGQVFEDEKISGEAFLTLTREQLRHELNFTIGEANIICRIITECLAKLTATQQSEPADDCMESSLPSVAVPLSTKQHDNYYNTDTSRKKNDATIRRIATDSGGSSGGTRIDSIAQLIKLNVLEKVAPRWKQFGYRLNFDEHGYAIDLIDSHHKIEGPIACCQKMFLKWLQGGEGDPKVQPAPTWESLLSILRDMGLKNFADELAQKDL